MMIMNINIKNTLRLGIIAAVGAAAMVSCTDTWNEHYDEVAKVVYDGTTMQAIEEQAPDFAAVIKAVGYDRELTSANVYTIWAPQNINKDSLLALAKTDSAAVVDQFIKNHVARYAVSDNGTEQEITLMSSKNTTMTTTKFGTSSLVSGKTNISCTNGLIHVIDNNINYQHNIFELIEHNYKKSSYASKALQGGSLYSFLQVWNKDSLDEDRSVSRGVDEDGEKIWVDSVVIRNNTVLKNVDALVYEEDSSYIAILPSDKAYNERYDYYKNLLVFNPNENLTQEGRADSLQNYYANMFAMEDLFYNINANEHIEDSLKSSTYRDSNNPYNVYYRKDKRNQPKERPTHDILAGLTPIDCSNGTAYEVDEYPMSPTEQSFRRINIPASSANLAVATDASSQRLYTRYVSESMSMLSGTLYDYDVDTIWNDDHSEVIRVDSTYEGTRSYRFLDVVPSSSSSNPNVAFFIPNTLSGTYDLYIVTCPIWARTGFNNGEKLADDPRGYRFYTYVWERENDGKNIGEYPSTGTRLVPIDPTTLSDADKAALGEDTLHLGKSTGNYYITDPTNKIDTLYLGEYTFKNTYYGLGRTENQAGVMIQFVTYISSALRNTYSREMLISRVILKPKDNVSAAEDAKRRK